MNAPVTDAESTALTAAPRQQFDLSPQTFDQALTFSQYLADSDLVPKDFKGKPGNCLIAMQWGSELGLKPLQALQNLAIINGRPSLWGDAVIALVRGSPLCEWVIETDDGNVATCRVKRRGEPEQARTFSMEDAHAAGLKSKQGPWSQYPKRMRQMRARAFALRDVFPDVLRGLPVAEEVMDTPAGDAPPTMKHMGAADVVQPQAAAPAAEATPSRPAFPAADFDKGLPIWKKAAAKLPVAEVLARAEAANPDFAFTEAQKATILSLKKDAPTFAAVADAIEKAANMEALGLAGDLIKEVAGDEQRSELQAKYDAREAALKVEA